MICFSFETSVPEDRYRLNTNDGNMKKFGELTDISGKGILDKYSSKSVWSVFDKLIQIFIQLSRTLVLWKK